MREKKQLSDILYNARIKKYPSGRVEVLVCNHSIFREKGWEIADKWEENEEKSVENVGNEENLARSRRRARSIVRDLAYSNGFTHFVTLTLDKRKIDRYDMEVITKALNTWLDNRVRRKGLKYVLVPERHEDGAVHFHGFFNDALPLVSSGHRDAGGHEIFNLPDWTYGFTTAIGLYGDYDSAVGYVCKYVGKQTEKIGGRWYYSGGALARPDVEWANLDFDELAAANSGGKFHVDALGVDMVQFVV